jgi:hypothetical protein
MSYAQVKDLYDTLYEAGVINESLQDWSAKKLRQTNNPIYQHGVDDSWLKRLSYGIDKAIAATGIDQQTAKFGRAVGELVGAGDTGEAIGQQIPRGVVNFAPLFIPGAGPVGLAARLGLSGLLAGAGAYEQTNSPAAGFVAGGTTAAMPGVARLFEIGALKALGVTPIVGQQINNYRKFFAGAPNQVSNVAWWLPKNRVQGITAQAAGQVGASLWSETGAVAQSLVDPNSEYKFSPTTLLLDLTLGQVPFGAVYLTKQGRVHLGGRTTQRVIEQIKTNDEIAQRAIKQKETLDNKNNQSPVEGIPVNPLSREADAKEAAQIQAEIDRIVQFQKEATETDVSSENLKAAQVEEANLRSKLWKVTDGETTPGVQLDNNSFNVRVRGQVHFDRPETGYRIIKIEDPQNAVYSDGTPVQVGDLVGFARKFEPENNGENNEWVLPKRYFSKVIDKPYISKVNIDDEQQPVLPKQPDGESNYKMQMLDAKNIREFANRLKEAKTQDEIDAIAETVDPNFRKFNYSLIESAKQHLAREAELLKLNELTQRLRFAESHAEIDSIAAEFNHAQMQAGREPLPEKIIFNAKEYIDKRQALNLETKRKELQRLVNKQTRRLKEREKLAAVLATKQQEFYEFEAEVIRKSVDPTVPEHLQNRLKKVAALITRYKEQSGPADTGRRRQVLESGMFKAEAAKWLLTNEPLSQLEAKFRDAIEKGTGLQKVKALEPIEPAKRVTLQEQIDAIMEHITMSGNADALLDAQNALQGKAPLAELRAILEDYGLVENSRIEGVKKSPNYTAKETFKPFVPYDNKQKAVIDSIGETGRSALAMLQKSKSRWISALGFSLEQNVGVKADMVKILYGTGLGTDGYSIVERNGRAKIVLDGNVLQWSTPTERAVLVLHELLHAFTTETLDTSISFKRSVDSLRVAAMRKLPKEYQVAIRKAIATNWYDRWSKDKAPLKELHPNPETASILYSFLNAYEFISNGITDARTQKLLRQMKVDGVTVTEKIRNLIKALWNKDVPDSVYDQLLDVTHRITRHDGSMAAARSVIEQYLENEGYDPFIARDMADQAFALLPIAKNGDGNALMDVLFDVATATRREDLTLQAIERGFASNKSEYVMLNSLFRELGLREGLVGVETLSQALLRGELPDGKAILELLPPEVRAHVAVYATHAHGVLKGLDILTDAEVAKVEGWQNNPEQRAAVNEAIKNVQQFYQKDDAVARMVGQLQTLTDLDYTGYLDVVHRSPKQTFLGSDITEQQVSKVTQFWMRAAQLARVEPLFAEAVTKGYQLISNARIAVISALEPFSRDLKTGQISKTSVNELMNQLKQRPIVKAVDELLHLAQVKGLETNSVGPVDFNSPEAQRILQRLDVKQQEAVKTLLAQKHLSQQLANKNTLESMRHVSELQAAALIADQTSLTVDQTLTLAKELFDVHLRGANDPMARERLIAVQQRLAPQQFLTLLKATETQAAIYKEWEAVFERNPWWTSARRYGKWQAILSNGKRIAADTQIELRAIAKEERATIKELIKRSHDDEAPHFGKALESAIPRLRELEANMHAMLEKVLSPEDMAAVKKRSIVEQFAIEAREAGLSNIQARGRQLGRGAELVPYLKNHFTYIRQNATFWARNRYAAEINLLLKNPAYKERPDVVQMIKKQGENILYPDPEHTATVTRFVTHYLLGFNVSSALINATQLFIRGAAELTALNGNPLKSYKALLDVLHELGSGKWKTPEHEWLMQRAVHDGEVGLSRYDEEQAANDVVASNIMRQIAGAAPTNTANFAVSALGGLANASMFLFRQMEMINTRGALLMGFDYWRSQGLSKEAAYLKATEFNHFVNDTGGRVNRSLGAFGGRDPFSRSTAMLANSMMAYVAGTAGQIATYLKQGFFQTKTLTPAQKYNARIALVQMMTVQLVAAGVMGMPFVSGIIAVLEKAFPELELTKNIREFFNSLFADDDESGNPLVDVAMTGLPSMFGWDFQSRLSMGAIPGVNDFDGFQPQQLLGAPLSVASNLVNGVTKIARGEVAKGVKEVLPPAFKKLFDLIRNEGVMTDHKDRPILHPTPGETFGAIIGFNPKRLSDFNAASRMAIQSEKIATNVRNRERQQLANAILQGNIGIVRQHLLAQKENDPEFDVETEVKALARTAEALIFPRDLRIEGSAHRSQVLKMFRLNPTQSDSEQARIQFRQAIEAQFGIKPKNNRSMREAVLIDRLRERYPNATRTELRRMILRGPEMHSLLLEQQ